MSMFTKVLIGLVVSAAAIVGSFSVVGAGTADPSVESEADRAAELAEANAVLAACEATEREGLDPQSREYRAASYGCLSLAFPDWYSTDPTPLRPPTDWVPDERQLELQSRFTQYVVEMLTEQEIEFRVVVEPNGAEWVDYDELDPVAAEAIGPIVASFSEGGHEGSVD